MTVFDRMKKQYPEILDKGTHGTGIFINDEEKRTLETQIKTSGMWLSGGKPMGDPGYYVLLLQTKYNVPAGTALDPKTGEFVYVVEVKR